MDIGDLKLIFGTQVLNDDPGMKNSRPDQIALEYLSIN